MLMTNKIMVKWHNKTRKHYEERGYIFTSTSDEFEINTMDLTDGNNIRVEVRCDYCGKVITPKWQDYLKCLNDDGKYYCFDCKHTENILTFEQWCLDNSRHDILARWDYDLNNKTPNEMSYSVNKKYYFKCPKGIHVSELKNINSFTSGQEGSIKCKQCNSFAQWGIDNIDKDFLNLYWNYDKNNRLELNPWEITHSSKKKMFIICQEKDYHGSYEISCKDFINGKVKCPYCSGKKVHPLDSLGQYILDNYGEKFLSNIWSKKNIKSAYSYSPKTNKKVWWKCLDGKHKDYYREVNSSKRFEFRCSSCQFSKGEKSIENCLFLKSFVVISYENYKLLNKKDIINNKYCIPQKQFDNLLGVGLGNLSYDFYLPNYNLLIEYQGQYHDGTAGNQTEEEFITQQEHDKRKKQYTENNNIKLLPIWYWDYDNIKTILERELNI